jgi:twitching motility protein PilT
MALDIAQLLAFAVKNKASDLHLSAGGPPMIRVDGDMKRVNLPDMSHKDVQSMVYDIMNDKQRKAYEEFLETDFSFEIPSLARFRVNVFNQNRGAAAVFRTIPTLIHTLEELQTPRVFRELCMLPRGLVLVTGPTGSGKSTTLAAMPVPRTVKCILIRVKTLGSVSARSALSVTLHPTTECLPRLSINTTS